MAGSFRIEHIGIPARGELFDQTVTFYERVFGMRRVREVNGNQHLCFLADDHGMVIEILDVEGNPTAGPGHVAFVVPLAEYDETRARLADEGIAFDPTVVTDTDDKLAYFKDPAGNSAQLIGRKDALV